MTPKVVRQFVYWCCGSLFADGFRPRYRCQERKSCNIVLQVNHTLFIYISQRTNTSTKFNSVTTRKLFEQEHSNFGLSMDFIKLVN